MADDRPTDAAAEPEADLASGATADADEGADGDAPSALEAERDAFRDRYLRAAAEFENYKKRMAREHEEVRVRAGQRLIVELLPVADDLERALDAFDQHMDEPEKVRDGVALVHRALATLLEREGVREVAPAVGDAFDPNFHEALLSQPAEQPADTVLGVIQKGFLLGERVIRPARVVVSAGPAGA